MIELSSTMRLWEEWQLRGLVLSSAFLQLFLLFTATKRAVLAIPSWLRLCIWLAYLGSDTVAIYALATLFNRHSRTLSDNGNVVASASILEVVWAPVLLVHLGGPSTISAYNMEDNELWPRHVLTFFTQVSVAVYVFCKSWPPQGEKLMLAAAVLLFILGIIRLGVKPLSLKRASINCLAPSVSTFIGTGKMFRLFDRLAYLCAHFTSDALFFEYVESVPYDEVFSIHSMERPLEQTYAYALVEVDRINDISVQDFVREAKNCVQQMAEVGARRDYNDLRSPYSGPESFLLADRLLPYSRRLNILRSFLEWHESQRMRFILDTLLGGMFRLLYTKEKLVVTGLGSGLLWTSIALSCAAIGLFAKAHKDSYNMSDVIVTYILLCLIAAMEALQPCLHACHESYDQENQIIPVAQHNIISFVLRKKRPTKLMMLAALVGHDDYVNKHWHVRHDYYSGKKITELVLGQLQEGWMEYIHDATSYRKFNNRRGQWTLSRHEQILQGCHSRVVRRSLHSVPFDESVLLWHIATDLCFHHPKDASPIATSSSAISISNYMAYLLVVQPEMMMPGTRQDLFIIACHDIESMLRYDDEPPLDEGKLAQGIICKLGRFQWLFGDRITPLLWEATRLAGALMEIGDEEAKWKLIEGVWVEMLCYSASRCRGYLHAKALGQGGELLSYVWLLLSHMGMEAFADRFQMPDVPEEYGIDGGGSRLRRQENNDRPAAAIGSTSQP